MELNLRPMGLPELLDRSVSIYRSNFLLFIGIVAIVTVPLTLAQVLAALLFFPTSTFTGTGFGSTVSTLVYYALILMLGIVAAFGGIIQMAALAVAVSERYHGRTITLKAVYARTLRRWDSLLVVFLILGAVNGIVFLVLFGGPFFMVLLSSASASAGAGVVGVLLMLLSCLAFLPAIILLAFLDSRWALTLPALMVENLHALSALGRSWRLVKGYFWRVLGALILLVAFMYFLSLVPTMLIQMLALFIAAATNSVTIMTALNAVVSAIMNIVITPIQFTVLTLLYYDIRIRKEGYDLQLRAEAMNLSNGVHVEPGPAAASPSTLPAD